ncbi:hypothetical protein [Bacteroides sp. 51]|uniref:hypothetical protein n=1 Tax=Bacteroides sp. 51 TaxID=2302938 RepID=UPI0013CFFE2A|nr:hypothetical protein [Bacteroides sp. 51]NDV83439.1 hypothetical protein [Bacteroides sp. 51]
MSLDIEKIKSNFNKYVEAKKKQALYLKLFFAMTTFLNLAVLCFAYFTTKNAHEQVLVVSTHGEILPVELSTLEKEYLSLLETHCYSVSHYVNTFDVNNIKTNQACASFLVNQIDLNAIFEKYQHDKAYNDVLHKGVAYRCQFEKVTQIKRTSQLWEYDVEFLSTLSVVTNSSTAKIQIVSRGTAHRTTMRPKENPTGWYFKNYTQEYYPINK